MLNCFMIFNNGVVDLYLFYVPRAHLEQPLCFHGIPAGVAIFGSYSSVARHCGFMINWKYIGEHNVVLG